MLKTKHAAMSQISLDLCKISDRIEALENAKPYRQADALNMRIIRINLDQTIQRLEKLLTDGTLVK